MNSANILALIIKFFSQPEIDKLAVNIVMDIIDRSVKSPVAQARYASMLRAIADRINKELPTLPKE